MKLTKRHLNVLRVLSDRAGWTAQYSLPDGNGHACGGHNASNATMRELSKNGLVEYGKEPTHSLYGYRITDAGREALKEGP